jgi:hypothetical protein
VTPYSVTYNGNPHTATGTATGVGGLNLSGDLNLTGTTHTNAGAYSTDAWSFTDPTGNYANVGATTITDTIQQATATITMTPYSVTYNGNSHTATGTATGVGGLNLSGDLNLSQTTHTNAGSYTADAWTFTDSTGNYVNTSGTVPDMIGHAPVTATAGSYAGVFNGAAQTPSSCVVSGAFTGNLTCSNNPSIVGPSARSGVIVPVPTGSNLSNFNITLVDGSYAISSGAAKLSLASSTGGSSNYGQLVTITPTVVATPAVSKADYLSYSYTNSSINSGASVFLGSMQLSAGGYSTFLLPPGSNTITATFNSSSADPSIVPDVNFGSSSATITQTVVAVPVAYLSPASAAFPNTDVGATSASIPVILTNIGAAPLNISSVQIVSGTSAPADFIVQSSTCGSTLPAGPTPLGPPAVTPGTMLGLPFPPAPAKSTTTTTVAVDNSCTVTVAFAPQPQQSTGPRTGTLIFTDNDGGQSSATDYIALTGSALSAISVNYPMPVAATIAAGNYVWFNSAISVQGPLDASGNPLNLSTDTVQIMVTNGSISFTNPATGAATTIAVPDGLIQFVSGLTQASTTFDAVNDRWITKVPMTDPASGNLQFTVPGNIFATGVPYLVPSMLPGVNNFAPLNVTWSAEYTTDTLGVNINWQWGAAVYNACFGNPASTAPSVCNANPVSGESLLENLSVLGVNSVDPGNAPVVHPNVYNAGTLYNYTGDLVVSRIACCFLAQPAGLYASERRPVQQSVSHHNYKHQCEPALQYRKRGADGIESGRFRHHGHDLREDFFGRVHAPRKQQLHVHLCLHSRRPRNADEFFAVRLCHPGRNGTG